MAKHGVDGGRSFVRGSVFGLAQFFASRVPYRKLFLLPVPFQLAFPQWWDRVIGRLWSKLKQRTFLTARPGIQDENLHSVTVEKLSFVILCVLRSLGKHLPTTKATKVHEGKRGWNALSSSHDSVFPLPVQNLRHVDAVLMNVLFVLDKFVTQELFEMSANALQFGNAVDGISREMKAVQIVHHRHIKRRGRGAFFFIAAHVHIVVVVTAVRQPMDEPRISVISKD